MQEGDRFLALFEAKKKKTVQVTVIFMLPHEGEAITTTFRASRDANLLMTAVSAFGPNIDLDDIETVLFSTDIEKFLSPTDKVGTLSGKFFVSIGQPKYRVTVFDWCRFRERQVGDEFILRGDATAGDAVRKFTQDSLRLQYDGDSPSELDPLTKLQAIAEKKKQENEADIPLHFTGCSESQEVAILILKKFDTISILKEYNTTAAKSIMVGRLRQSLTVIVDNVFVHPSTRVRHALTAAADRRLEAAALAAAGLPHADLPKQPRFEIVNRLAVYHDAVEGGGDSSHGD